MFPNIFQKIGLSDEGIRYEILGASRIVFTQFKHTHAKEKSF